MAATSPIVGSIYERKPLSSASRQPLTASHETGFPTVQHRSRSAFARNRENVRAALKPSRRVNAPILSSGVAAGQSEVDEAWRERISKENEERVAQMEEVEREEEKQQILERFGSNIGDVLQRVRLARERQKQSGKTTEPVYLSQGQLIPSSYETAIISFSLASDEVPISSEERRLVERGESIIFLNNNLAHLYFSARSPPPSALVSPTSTRPSSRIADRRLRFADLEPDDVHVYESAPSSPKRRVLALPPPDPDLKDVISLGRWRGEKLDPPKQDEPTQPQRPPEPRHCQEASTSTAEDPEEGSPEYIRRRYFPHAPRDDPNLAWLTGLPKPGSTSALRFDLHGNPISPAISLNLPTHLGLHHHAEGAHAGYTLDDIFLLSRSTVRAQRATMLGVMAGIVRCLTRCLNGEMVGMDEMVGRESELRKRFLAAGLEALPETGSVGARAVEVVWECVVGWRPGLVDIEGVELESPQEMAITDLPLDSFLPQITKLVSEVLVPPESQIHLLSVLHRLSQQSNPIANKIAGTPQLLQTVMSVFLLTPLPVEESSPLPNPLALQLFYALSLSSRTNAEAISRLADSLLRFVTFLPQESPYPLSLSINLLTWTFRIYRVLAAYGLYTHIASTAVMPLARLEQYVVSKRCPSSLKVAWLNVVEVWITCAIDPHQTTPAHDIKWSQITGWRWDACVLELQGHLGVHESDWATWAAAWNVQAAWLEGSQINGVKKGEAERNIFFESALPLFETGTASQVVNSAVDLMEHSLIQYMGSDDQTTLARISTYALLLSSAMRLWISCIPPHIKSPPSTPPFLLPFSRLGILAANVVTHPLWPTSSSTATPATRLYFREISQFLGFFLRLSQRLPDTTDPLNMAQSCSILLRLYPGDEDVAEFILRGILSLATTYAQNAGVPSASWQKGGMAIIEPFLNYKVRPPEEFSIGPLCITPKSIKTATTQRLPSLSGLKQCNLPLSRDWMTTPIDHLLRSADSDVFKALPPTWDASELQVAQVTLFLTKLVRDTLMQYSMLPMVLTREEAIFRCMQIFMLEHGQSQTDSTEDVFRDSTIDRLMGDILRIYAYGTNPPFPTGPEAEDVEQVAARFLGPSVPFFQFYTEFVALYDAISFGHPLFASLLLPPTATRYPQDYRKHLWCDFGHVMRSVRTSPEKMLSADLREYLFPVDTSPDILNAQLGLLLKDSLGEFPRLMALHHVASSIWPDLQELVNGKYNGGQASALLKVVVQQGGNELVREIVRYHQKRPEADQGLLLLPPECFDGLPEESRRSRREHVLLWGGAGLLSKIDGLLK